MRAPQLRAVPPLATWQILFLAASAGLAAARWPLAAVVSLAVLAFCAQVAGRRLSIVLLLVSFTIGLGYCALRTPDGPGAMPAFMAERRTVELAGCVAEVAPRPGNKLRIVLRDASCTLDDGQRRELGAVVWTWLHPSAMPGPGQRVSLRARIKPVRGFLTPGSWDMAAWWGTRGVFWRTFSEGERGSPSVTGSARFDWGLRLRLADSIRRVMEEGQARAMVLALAMGDRSELSQTTLERMRAASLAHSMALSGLHLGLVASIGLALAWLVGRLRPGIYLRLPLPRLAVILAAPPVLFYLWLGGATPSLLRATAMFASFAALLLLGRGRPVLDGLFLALAAILLVSPLTLFDLGLQLSALAVAGIALAAPHIARAMRSLRSRPARAPWLGSLLAGMTAVLGVSLAANLAILPLSLFYFGEFQPSLFWNLVWLPVLAWLVLPLSLAGTLLAAMGLDTIAAFLLHPAGAVISAFLGLLGWAESAGLTPVVATVRPLWTGIIGYYLLLLWCLGLRGRGALAWLLPAAALVLLVAPRAATGVAEQGKTSLTMLDVGQGQALEIRAPSGERWLLDGGGVFSRTFDIGRAVVAPYLTRGREPALAGLVLSHPHPDHGKGLIYLMRRFRVETYADIGLERPAGWLDELDRAAAASKADRLTLAAGQRLDLGGGLALDILHPAEGFEGNVNESSLVARLVWRGRGLALLPGDVEDAGLEALLDSPADLFAEVLVLPHHGSSSGAVEEFFERASPSLALVSAGHLNGYNLPADEVLAKLGARGVDVYGTHECGALRVTWHSPAAGPVVERLGRLPRTLDYAPDSR